MTNNLDRNTKITMGAAIGVLTIVVSAATGGAWSMSALVTTVNEQNSRLTAISSQFGELRVAVEQLARQLTESEKGLAVLKTLIEIHERRIRDVEQRK